MRILVYGAGVLGCELAHVLLQNKKNDVTLLARGEWKERIAQKGLVIVVVDSVYFTAVILLIVVSSIVTPLALKGLFAKG